MPAIQYQLLRYTPTEVQLQLAENTGRGNPRPDVHLGFIENIWGLGRASPKCVLTPPPSIHHPAWNKLIYHKPHPQNTRRNPQNSTPVSIQRLSRFLKIKITVWDFHHKDSTRINPAAWKRGAQAGEMLPTVLTEQKGKKAPRAQACYSIFLAVILRIRL